MRKIEWKKCWTRCDAEEIINELEAATGLDDEALVVVWKKVASRGWKNKITVCSIKRFRVFNFAMSPSMFEEAQAFAEKHNIKLEGAK